jgi:hypothetical protein
MHLICLAQPSGSHGGKAVMSIWRNPEIAGLGWMDCRTRKGLQKVVERLRKAMERCQKVMDGWKGLQVLRKGPEHGVVGGIVDNP